MPRPVKPWSTADLKHRCRAIRAALGEVASASDDELRAYWPGGAENLEKGRGGWIYCYANYVRMLGRTEPLSSSAEASAVDAAIAARSAAQPIPVTLVSGAAVAVHPKSYHALRFLDFLDAGLRWAARAVQAANEFDDEAAIKVIQLYPLAESFTVRLWAWVLTTPDAGLPFADDATDVQPPEWTRALTALDLLRLARAHQQVNHEDAQLIAKFFPGDSRPTRLSLAGFLNTYAGETHARPRDVFRVWSLGEVFANAVSAAAAAREARAHAEQAAAERRAGA